MTYTTGPLRLVVRSRQMTNYTLDTLACGHDVADYDNREVRRRRCGDCGNPQTPPWEGNAPFVIDLGRKAN